MMIQFIIDFQSTVLYMFIVLRIKIKILPINVIQECILGDTHVNKADKDTAYALIAPLLSNLYVKHQISKRFHDKS
jgi:hypothetical protein